MRHKVVASLVDPELPNIIIQDVSIETGLKLSRVSYGRGGGLVASVLACSSGDPSLIPADC